MRFFIVAASLLLCLAAPLRADQYSEDAGYNIPTVTPKAQESDKLDDIESRLSSDMMFAGKLADAMIESGVYSKYVKQESSDDYASLRTRLIFWIRSHPREAAQLHLSSVNPAQPGSPSGEETYDEKKLAWALNNHFIDVAKQLEADAKNGHLSNEDASMAMRRLFEGTQSHPSGATPVVNLGGNGPVSGGAPRIQLAPFNWKVDASAMDGEIRETSSWLNTLRGELARDRAVEVSRLTGAASAAQLADSPSLMQKLLAATVNGRTVSQLLTAEFSKRDALLAEAAKDQDSFSAYVTRFSGRKKIQESEAKTLNQLRCGLRNDLAKSYVAGKLDGMTRIKEVVAQVASSTSPYAAAFGAPYAQAGKNIAALAAVVQDAYNAAFQLAESGAPAELVYARMNAACADDDNWRAVAHIYCVLPEMKLASLRLWTPVPLNRLLGKLSLNLYPSSTYSLAERGLRDYGRVTEALAQALAAGNYQWVFATLAGITGADDPHRNVALLSTQYYNCIKIVNDARMKTDLFQSVMFDLPCYRTVSPLVRSALIRLHYAK